MGSSTDSLRCTRPALPLIAFLISLGICFAYFFHNNSNSPEGWATAKNTATDVRGHSTPSCPDDSDHYDTCLDPCGPQPYILMTLGRSGSGSTWQIIGNLTGYETPSEEYTGGGYSKSVRFFEEHGGDRWLLRNLCSKQLSYPKAGVVGFKWKPYDTIFSSSAQAGLRTIAALDKPRIKIVRLRRNLLDVIISRYKHKIYNGKTAEKVVAHCLKGDDECIKKGLNASIGLQLPTKQLLKELRSLNSPEDEVDKMLVDMKIPHVQVTYEELYYGKDTSEWMKIFSFLGIGPAEGLTKERLEEAMEHQATHPPTHNVTLGNFQNVSNILRGTEFESLLH